MKRTVLFSAFWMVSNILLFAIYANAGTTPLANTSWRLVEIQSMDDATGTVRPKDPARFTMMLNGDGTVSMQVDCNRARGSWEAKPSADRKSGSFSFGKLASTRALCPPPHLDEKIMSQAGYIRSYLLKDGRLHLSLMADGGIWIWEPLAAGGFETVPDKELETAILKAVPDYTRASVDAGGDAGKGRYVFTRLDLNNDGHQEVLVYLLGPAFCGTGGCNLLLFTPLKQGYRLVNSFPITRLPIILAPAKHKGWHDLIRPESGGGAGASYVRHVFNGKRYQSSKRLPAGKVPEGTSYLSGDVGFDSAIPLEPQY